MMLMKLKVLFFFLMASMLLYSETAFLALSSKVITSIEDLARQSMTIAIADLFFVTKRQGYLPRYHFRIEKFFGRLKKLIRAHPVELTSRLGA